MKGEIKIKTEINKEIKIKKEKKTKKKEKEPEVIEVDKLLGYTFDKSKVKEILGEKKIENKNSVYESTSENETLLYTFLKEYLLPRLKNDHKKNRKLYSPL